MRGALLLLLLAACAELPAPDEALPPITGTPRALTGHDVTVLLPLPAVGDDTLWPASTPSRGGPLVPRAVFDDLGRSLVNDVDDGDEYDALRVVAVRVDPCFLRDWGAASCQPQLRLVLQALDVDGGRARDGAVHALYNLDDAELAELVTALRELTAAAPEQADAAAPLGVSPALVAQGLDGVYGLHLRALVTRFAGEGNLARLTFMTRDDTRAGRWQFGGRAVREDLPKGFGPPGPLVIRALGLDVTLQTVSAGLGEPYAYDVAPMIAAVDGEPAVAAAHLVALPAAERVETYAWALRQASPLHVTADSTDCASCHLADRARDFLEGAYPELVDDAERDGRPAYVPGAVADASNLRALGYFGATPVVTLRTAAETRFVLDQLAVAP